VISSAGQRAPPWPRSMFMCSLRAAHC